MKTLKDIKSGGDLSSYMDQLGSATRSIMPSRDGHPDSRCQFVVILTDGPNVEFVSDVKKEKLVQLLKWTSNQIRSGRQSQCRNVDAVEPDSKETLDRVLRLLAENDCTFAIEILNNNLESILRRGKGDAEKAADRDTHQEPHVADVGGCGRPELGGEGG